MEITSYSGSRICELKGVLLPNQYSRSLNWPGGFCGRRNSWYRRCCPLWKHMKNPMYRQLSTSSI